jgi:hypothetical protein
LNRCKHAPFYPSWTRAGSEIDLCDACFHAAKQEDINKDLHIFAFN